MAELVSRNTIKLAASASSTNNYYTGYTIILTRYDNVTGKELVQKKGITAYDGGAKIATIDGIWDADFIPGPTDTYKIVPTYADDRVSINPAIQTLDYITSTRYGKGLDPHKDLHLGSWLESGRICDTQSDVTVRVTNGTSGVVVGAVYHYSNQGLHWQGKVKSVKDGYVRFTDVIGKLANKWNSWKPYRVGTLVYDDNVLYAMAAAGTAPMKPPGGAFVPVVAVYLEKLSGAGTQQLRLPTDGNPVRDVNARGITISGYSLYDSDGIDYWRYVGWDGQEQRYATRHQTNLVVDTSATLFDNINSLLEHFGGILRYTAGRYYLEVEEGEGEISTNENEPRNISADSIIGKIRINDEGIRSSFNSLTVAYADPANKFEAKNISFFNSEFLKSDRNVPKKGNLSIAGITNYYNARLLADKFLVKSRFGLTISFNMMPKGILLLAGKVIQVQHPRYGWVNKKFRIENITHNTDTSVDVVAKEYDDSFYVISNISRPPAAANAGESTTTPNVNPNGLKASSMSSEDETIGGIELSWRNSANADATVSTELYGSYSGFLYRTATKITGNGWVSFGPAHGMVSGETIIPQESKYGLEAGVTYYAIIDPDPKQVEFVGLSRTRGGPTVATIATNGASIKLMTATLIATVQAPASSYIDVINTKYVAPTPDDPDAPPPEDDDDEEPVIEEERIQKSYWIRHKVTQT